ncbi:flagellar hook-associated protein FlgL [Desulfosporosinus metallidurans]|uniref:Flagellar hook-associated protein FlgL n=1 Tax=Desulfosporosinus metallidurans TaxID=1888891 RepID=A0A1Q8R1M5_9FIRM|nr:flagellar hook-associated protein FlgL [Desulfosporosinus metallidurans]OLN33529.1 Flagellar hook-associated protein FlgL [Desulfosporosinus metallidurans]
MRITNNILSQNLLRNLETAQGKMDQLQNQLSTGLRISKPSDDPVGIENAMRLKSNISSVEQWKSNADSALEYMNTSDSILGDMTSMLQRVKELAVQGANGTLTTADKSVVADEVDQIKDQLKMMANTQVGSRYIFSGTATDKELIPTDGSTSVANGNPVNFQVGNNKPVDISVNGQTLFGDNTTGIIATLTNLSTALRANNSTDINTALGTIDTNIDNVIAIRSELGARTNRITAIRDQLDSTSTNLQQNLSDIQDADMAKTITDFTNQQNTYKAALAVGAQIIQPSLVDFMK